jgi:hypothetical protein
MHLTTRPAGRLAAPVLVSSLALLGVALAQGQAAAAPCPSGALCAYTSPNYVGTPGPVYGNNRNLLQYYRYDNAESVVNNGRRCSVRIYTGRNYSGPNVLIPRGYGYSNLYTQNRPMYHNIASNLWC